MKKPKNSSKSMPESTLSRQLSSIFDSIADIVFYLSLQEDNTYKFHYVNSAFLKATGLTKDKILNKYQHEVISLKPRQQELDNYQNAIKGQKPVSWEDKSTYSSGPEAVLKTVTPWFNESGSCTYLIVTVRNISDHKISAPVHASESEFKALVERVSDGFVTFDKNWTYTYVNKRAGEILKREPDSLIGKNVWTEFPDAVGHSFYHAYQKAMTGQTYEYLDVYYPPYKKWIENHIYPSTNGLSIFFRDVTQEREFSIALKESEEKYRMLVEEAYDGIFIFDPLGNYESANTSGSLMTGYIKEELKRLNILEMILAGDETKRAFYFEALKQKRHVISEGKFQRKDGSLLDVEVSAKMLPDGNILGVLRDITDQIKARQEIILEKELSENIINSLPGIFYLYNRDRILLRWNKNLETVTGYSTHEISALHPIDFFDNDEKELLTKKIENVFVSGADSVEAHFLLKNRQKIPYYFTGVATEYRGETCLIGVGIDISERKKSEALLQKSNSQLLSAQQIAHLGYWEWDLKNNSIYWSDEMYKICGLENKGEISRENFLSMVHLDDSNTLEEKFTATIKDNAPGNVEFRFIRNDGTIRNVIARIAKATNDCGELNRLEGTLQDITEQRNYMKAIEEQNKKLREIAWLQSHGVRAPLARIMGLINVINMKSMEAADNHQLLNHILSSATELDKIVREIVNKTEQIENQPRYEFKNTAG